MPLVALWELVLFLLRFVATSGWSITRAVTWFSVRASAVGTAAVVVDSTGEEFFGDKWAVFQGHVRNLMAKFANFEGGNRGFNFVGDDFYDIETFASAITRNVSAKSGIPLRDVLDKDKTRDDLENYALGQIEARTTYRLRSLRNVELLREDFLGIAAGVITDKTGIPITDISDPEKVKADVMAWAKDQVMLELGDDVHAAVNAEWQQGVTLLQMVRDRTGKNVSPKALLRGVNDALVKRYMVRVEETAKWTREDWKRHKNKIAQREFRARHKTDHPELGFTGGRSVYQRLFYKDNV